MHVPPQLFILVRLCKPQHKDATSLPRSALSAALRTHGTGTLIHAACKRLRGISGRVSNSIYGMVLYTYRECDRPRVEGIQGVSTATGTTRSVST